MEKPKPGTNVLNAELSDTLLAATDVRSRYTSTSSDGITDHLLTCEGIDVAHSGQDRISMGSPPVILDGLNLEVLIFLILILNFIETVSLRINRNSRKMSFISIRAVTGKLFFCTRLMSRCSFAILERWNSVQK